MVFIIDSEHVGITTRRLSGEPYLIYVNGAEPSSPAPRPQTCGQAGSPLETLVMWRMHLMFVAVLIYLNLTNLFDLKALILYQFGELFLPYVKTK